MLSWVVAAALVRPAVIYYSYKQVWKTKQELFEKSYLFVETFPRRAVCHGFALGYLEFGDLVYFCPLCFQHSALSSLSYLLDTHTHNTHLLPLTLISSALTHLFSVNNQVTGRNTPLTFTRSLHQRWTSNSQRVLLYFYF